MKGMAVRQYLCPQAASPLKIDGLMQEPAWQNAPWTEDFLDIEGPEKPAPRFRTRAKMLWDQHYFYIGAELEEPQVWATLTNHDAIIFHDPDFEVFIDPDGDSHNYYEFEINALNTGWDLLLKKPYKDGGPALNSWEIPGLKTATHVEGTLNFSGDRDRGWTVELAFPWKALREFAGRPAPPRAGDQWRINFSRVEWQTDHAGDGYQKVPGTKEDNWVWSPQGIIDMHRPEKWGYVQFIRRMGPQTAFVDDPAAPVRDLLEEIYYLERDFFAKHQRYTGLVPELELVSKFPRDHPPLIHLSAQGYLATAEVKLPDGKWERWNIREDARIWKE